MQGRCIADPPNGAVVSSTKVIFLHLDDHLRRFITFRGDEAVGFPFSSFFVAFTSADLGCSWRSQRAEISLAACFETARTNQGRRQGKLMIGQADSLTITRFPNLQDDEVAG
jgi:hypothetical protein